MDTGIGDNPVHETYLMQKASALCPVERNVITMMDEIHTGTEFSYLGGKIKGAAMDSTVDASTALVCTPLFANNDILIIILLIICALDLEKQFCNNFITFVMTIVIVFVYNCTYRNV